MNSSILCLNCGRSIDVNAKLQLGDGIVCPSCESEFEFVRVDPPEIEWLDDDDAAWDDDAWESDWDEDEEWPDEMDDLDDDEEWSWMIAKQQRLHANPGPSRRNRSRHFEYD